MSKKVTVDDLASEIMMALKDFEGVAEKDCEDGVLDTAEEAVKELHLAQPDETPVYQSWDKYKKRMGHQGDLPREEDKRDRPQQNRIQIDAFA